MPIKQANRLIAINMALGADGLGLRTVSVHEQTSYFFRIEAEFSSENGEIDLGNVIGHAATIRLAAGSEIKRVPVLRRTGISHLRLIQDKARTYAWRVANA